MNQIDYKTILNADVDWLTTNSSGQYAYTANVGRKSWGVRVNPDFPKDHLYALYIDGQEVFEFNDWPNSWDR